MSEEYFSVQGGCLCGAVRYEAKAALHSAYYCHCKTCQKSSGAPAEIGVYVKAGTLSFTKEAPRFFQASPFGMRGFCRECGSRIVWKTTEDPKWNNPEWTNVSVGSLDRPEDVIVVEHICVESQLPWYDASAHLPHKRSEDDPELIETWARAGLTHDGKAL